MAQETNYFPSQNVRVWYQKETEVGNSPDDDALKKMQITSFTIPEASVPVEYSAQQSGKFVQTASQGHHAQGTKMWTFDTVMRGTTSAILLATEAVFEQASSAAALNNDYAFPKNSYVNGSTNSPATFEFRFEDAGADSTKNNVICNGCVGTGFTLTEDIGSEGGELVVTINWATAFMPDNASAETDDAITSPAYDTGTPKNIRALASGTSGINGGALEELVIQSWELSVSRTMERIHYKDITDGSFAPFGYAMTGGFEVTGSLTCIRNNDVHDLLAKFYDSNTVDVNLTEGSDFIIALDKCIINEPSIDNGGAVLMETIPFTVVATDASASTAMVSITAAS